jgi:hypothetical protein
MFWGLHGGFPPPNRPQFRAVVCLIFQSLRDANKNVSGEFPMESARCSIFFLYLILQVQSLKTS